MKNVGIAIVALIACGSPASAACTGSDLTGNWQFTGGQVTCPVKVGSTGKVTTTGPCLSNVQGVAACSVTGNLKITTKCAVTGTLQTATGNCASPFVATQSANLWMSADGSRVSGYGARTVSEEQLWLGIELIQR
jgi:hypothetical protein